MTSGAAKTLKQGQLENSGSLRADDMSKKLFAHSKETTVSTLPDKRFCQQGLLWASGLFRKKKY